MRGRNALAGVSGFLTVMRRAARKDRNQDDSRNALAGVSGFLTY